MKKGLKENRFFLILIVIFFLISLMFVGIQSQVIHFLWTIDFYTVVLAYGVIVCSIFYFILNNRLNKIMNNLLKYFLLGIIIIFSVCLVILIVHDISDECFSLLDPTFHCDPCFDCYEYQDPSREEPIVLSEISSRISVSKNTDLNFKIYNVNSNTLSEKPKIKCLLGDNEASDEFELGAVIYDILPGEMYEFKLKYPPINELTQSVEVGDEGVCQVAFYAGEGENSINAIKKQFYVTVVN